MIKQVIHSIRKTNLAFVLALCIMIVGIFSEMHKDEKQCAKVEKVTVLKKNLIGTTQLILIPMAKWMVKSNTAEELIKCFFVNKEDE